MLLQKEENENEDNNNINRDNIQNNIREVIDGRNPRYSRRGFNIFLLHGLSLNELRTMRILFHLSASQQSLLRGEDLDWTEEAMLQREERWLISQLNGPLLNNNNNNEEQERDNERETIIRNNNNTYIRLNINENDGVRIRYEETLFNFEFEPIYAFLIGFCVGFIVNFFGIFLFFCRFHKRFKIGLIWGIITSLLFYSMIRIYL